MKKSFLEKYNKFLCTFSFILHLHLKNGAGSLSFHDYYPVTKHVVAIVMSIGNSENFDLHILFLNLKEQIHIKRKYEYV